MGTFILGILFGWLVEWLFFTFYWEPRQKQTNASASAPASSRSSASATAPVSQATAATPAAQSVAPEAKKAAPVAKKAASKPKKSTPAKKVASGDKDSAVKALQKVSGIGPKIAGVLVGEGVDSYKALAAASEDDLKKMLEASGTRFAMIDVASWPKQAGFLDGGDADGLAKYIESLKK